MTQRLFSLIPIAGLVLAGCALALTTTPQPSTQASGDAA